MRFALGTGGYWDETNALGLALVFVGSDRAVRSQFRAARPATRSLKPLPGLNAGTFVAGMNRVSPVRGFRPSRSCSISSQLVWLDFSVLAGCFSSLLGFGDAGAEEQAVTQSTNSLANCYDF